MQADTQSPPHNSTWSQIVYLLKLVRSTVIYNYRYDEAYEVASWYGVGLLIGSATVIGMLIERLIFYILLIGAESSASASGFTNVIDMLSRPFLAIDDPVFWIVSLLWEISVTALFMVCIVILVGYCIDLFFEVNDSPNDDIDNENEELEYSQSTWQQFAFAVAIVQAFRLLISPIVYSTQLISNLLSVGFEFWFPFPFIILIVLLIIAVLLTIYSWVVLYRFIKNRTIPQESSIWRYALVIIFLEGGIILIRLIFAPILNPIYNLIIQSIS